MRKVMSEFLWAGGALLWTGLAHAQEEAAAATGVGIARKIFDLLIEFCVNYSFRVLGGVIVLVCGWILGKFLAGVVYKQLQKHQVDVTVSKFIVTGVKFAVVGFAVLIALGKFGIEIAPFIAGLSVIGFGTSFALQGPLSNFAAGAILIFTKPFKVGDIIEVVGCVGEVEDMSLGRTLLRTVDGTHIVIPNKHIVGEVIHNDSEAKRVDIKVGVSYDSDTAKAVNIIKNILDADSRISQKIKPKIGIFEFADSSVNLYARLWCRQLEYWDVLFDLNKKILEAFNREHIVIPFPQSDIHIKTAPEGVRRV